MVPMENNDPRIDAIYEADPLLKLVGPGTIADVLKAAAKAGVVPAPIVTTEYAVGLNRPGLGIQQVASGSLSAAEALVEIQPGYNHPYLVSREVTTYAPVTGEWQAVPSEDREEAHV